MTSGWTLVRRLQASTPSGDGARRAAAIAVLVCQLAALTIVVGGPGALGFPLDDAWIHALAARTLVEHGTLGIVPGAHGSGATSTLWALLLAVGEALGAPAPVFALALNTVLFVLAGQCVLHLLLADGHSPRAAAIAAIGFGAAPNFVWFAASGMEATLFAALSTAAIACWYSPRPGPRRLTGVALGALALTRPEAVALVPLLALLRRPTTLREAGALLGVPALAVLAHAGVALVATGSALPTTLAGRRWMWIGPLEGSSATGRVVLLLDDWLDRLGEFTLGSHDSFGAWLALGLCAWGAADAWTKPGSRALLLFCLLHLAVYAVLLPTLGHGGRYQPLVPATFGWLLCLGTLRLVRDGLDALGPKRATPARIAIAIVALVLVALGPGRALFAWRVAHRDAVTHIERTEVAMGHVVARLPETARVASFDIGGIGYHARRPILELGGLTSNAIVPLLRQGRVAEYLERHAIDYVVLPIGLGGERVPEPWNFSYRLGLLQATGIELEPVATLESALDLWRSGLRATLHCAPRQTLYRVRYAGGGP